MNNSKELQFAVFLIRRLAESWQKSPSQVYKILSDTEILDEYIFSHYDILHTMGKEYLVEDITEFVREKGISV